MTELQKIPFHRVLEIYNMYKDDMKQEAEAAKKREAEMKATKKPRAQKKSRPK